MKKIEEYFEQIITYINNYHSAKDLSSRIYWIRIIYKTNKEVNKLLDD